jgi:xanthine dehydrogenase molybdopterin-binding subunit B
VCFCNIPAVGKSNITVGTDIQTALDGSYRTVRGHIAAGGQYHFYMEAMTAVACSTDGDNITVTCGSQYASAYQANIATVLGVPLNKVWCCVHNSSESLPCRTELCTVHGLLSHPVSSC